MGVFRGAHSALGNKEVAGLISSHDQDGSFINLDVCHSRWREGGTFINEALSPAMVSRTLATTILVIDSIRVFDELIRQRLGQSLWRAQTRVRQLLLQLPGGNNSGSVSQWSRTYRSPSVKRTLLHAPNILDDKSNSPRFLLQAQEFLLARKNRTFNTK